MKNQLKPLKRMTMGELLWYIRQMVDVYHNQRLHEIFLEVENIPIAVTRVIAWNLIDEAMIELAERRDQERGINGIGNE